MHYSASSGKSNIHVLKNVKLKLILVLHYLPCWQVNCVYIYVHGFLFWDSFDYYGQISHVV